MPPTPQRRATDPVLTRQGFLSHPGTLAMGLAGILFGAYIFNIGGTATFLNSFFNGLNSDARSHDHDVQNMVVVALPILGILVVSIILFMILKAIGRGARKAVKSNRLAPREDMTQREFVDVVLKQGISAMVGKHAYTLLLPIYHNRMRARFSDSLSRDLQLNRIQIADLYGNLLFLTDRQRSVQDQDTEVDTVLELLQAAERGVPRFRTDAAAPRIAPPASKSRIRQRLEASFIRPARLNEETRVATKAKTVAKP
jgi:NADH:ubiquinone oxidoreductase subunit 5 (subunit L)/multisubunit Na+/H+ antiporter MnhA subunit